MRSETAGRRLVSNSCSALCLALLTVLAGAAAARELEPDATLEGFPFRSAGSVTVSEDGRDLYAAGHGNSSSSYGLVWLRREAPSGRLELRRNYLSEGRDPDVRATALSPDQQHLYALTRTRIVIFLRGADGALEAIGQAPLPADFRSPLYVAVSPLGGQLLVQGSNGNGYQIRAYDRSLSGALTFRQTVTAGVYGKGAFLGEDLYLAGRSLLRRSGGGWTPEPLAGLEDVQPGDVLASPDAGLFYLRGYTGAFPHIHHVLIALALEGGQWIEAGRSALVAGGDREDTAIAIHPQSGGLYIASWDYNGGDRARIDHYTSADGGRTFTAAGSLHDAWHDLSARTRKESLAFSPDGRHLYATFDGEPMALLEVGADGSLAHRADAAGHHSHFYAPFRVLSIAPREFYVLTPAAILQSRWVDGGLALVSSLGLGDWPRQGTRRKIEDVVLTPGGGAGVVTGAGDLAFLERDRQTGALRLLADTTVAAGHAVERLTISPDGRHVYAVGGGSVSVYFLRRDVPKLVPVQVLPIGGVELEIAENGTDALLIRSAGAPGFLRRSIASGELEMIPFPYVGDLAGVRDAQFSRQGRLVHLFRQEGTASRIELLARSGDGFFRRLDLWPAPVAERGYQVVDPLGNSLYQLMSAGLDHWQWVLRDSQVELAPISSLDTGELGGVGALIEFLPIFDHQPSPLALLPGGNELAVSNHHTGNVRLFRRGCSSNLDAGACLAGNRFRVEVGWQDADGHLWPAQATSLGSDDARVYTFFDPSNWEMMVKVLDGCGINGRFWVFSAASTDVGFELRVTDTWTGERQVYRSAAGSPAPAITDSAAFATCGAAWPGWLIDPPVREPLGERPALLLDDRFSAKVSWTDHQGAHGQATALQQYGGRPRSGLFYFFDPGNWEMQVKVLDGCAINGHHWVLGAATTDAGYELEVFDPVSGLTRNYPNEAGTASPAILDLEAFPCQ